MSTRSTPHANELSVLDGGPLSEEAGLGALTLGGFLQEIAQRHADREALRWLDQRWTYAAMYAESERVARALLAAGAGRGTRVGVLISNRPEWIFSMFGAAMAGAITVALNTFSTRQELEYQLRHADVALLIMEAGVASKNFVTDIEALCFSQPHAASAKTTAGTLHIEAMPFLRRIVCVDNDAVIPGIERWDEFLATGDAISAALVAATNAASSPVDQALIFFSSGTTALPKAIQQTHRAAALQCWRFGRWFEIDETVRTWSANGFFWSGNFAMALGGTLSVGGCLVLQRYFNPDETLELLQAERVSLPIVWPHQAARLTECPGWQQANLKALKLVDVASAMNSHPDINSSWRQPNGYGMTETFTFITGFPGSQNTDGSTGYILAGNSLRIVDQSTNEILPLGQSGEIIVKGPTLTSGYVKVPPEDTFDREGFIHTGDAGHIGENGQLFWEGRLSDIIKTGGANVSPAEIDKILVEHPSVQTTFTIGIPHDTLGEIVVSCVVLREGQKLTEDDVRNFARESLASYKVPRRVLFFTAEELPMTGSNKIQRPELRKLVIARLG